MAAGFGLRLAYLLHSHPFFDEYTTILAAQQILRSGVPVLPSGLIYEHGLLFSYLDAPFVALAGWLSDSAGQGALFALARLPSLLIGVAAIGLLYRVGARWLSVRAGLVAAALLAFSPEGVVWGGRARMYALGQLLVLALAVLVYHGCQGRGNARLRWLALLVLLALLLTQFGAIILVPPLAVGAVVTGWLTRAAGERPWFLRRGALVESAALAGVVGLGVLVKRLGQPLGAAPLGSPDAGDLASELLSTITYQAGPMLDGGSLAKFLAREYGVPHHFWIAVLAVLGGLVALVIWLRSRSRKARGTTAPRKACGTLAARRGHATTPANPANGTWGYRSMRDHCGQPFVTLYVWLLAALPVLEMVSLLQPWRHNPRYLVMALPWFYLVVAAGVEHILQLGCVDPGPLHPFRTTEKGEPAASSRGAETEGRAWTASHWPCAIVFTALAVLAVLQARGLGLDLWVAFRTPEPAYEQAFRYVAQHRQDGDVVLTMNTSGAGLLLGGVDYFAVQEDAGQFLVSAAPPGGGEARSVDRWMGAPWLGSAAEFARVLNAYSRAWFVIDTIRLPVYYRGDWLAVLKTQLEPVWTGDEALVYLTRPDRRPLSTAPSAVVRASLGQSIVLLGYADSGEATWQPGGSYLLTLFWNAVEAVADDYTVFVHLRDAHGNTVAQHDSQPLGGDYPTSQWRPGETVIDPHAVLLPPDLPPGKYTVYAGLYRLDTLERLTVADDSTGERAIRLGDVTVQ